MLVEKISNGFITMLQLPEYPLPFRVSITNKVRVSLSVATCSTEATARQQALIEKHMPTIEQQLARLVRGCEYVTCDDVQFVRLANILHDAQPFRVCSGGEIQPESKRILRNITVLGWTPVCSKWVDGQLMAVHHNLVISDPAYALTTKFYRVHFVKYLDIGGSK